MTADKKLAFLTMISLIFATAAICAQPGAIVLPSSFPQSDYTPFGYIDNPYHSAVLNRSGVIRSVPPLGFGFWARRFPGAYGHGTVRPVNYLSLLHLSVNVEGVSLHTPEDFRTNNVSLASRYHTKAMMSYDWQLRGLSFSAKYFLAKEHSLICILEIANPGGTRKTVTIHATNEYGFPEVRWWGSDGVASRYNEEFDAGVAKIWAYGDVFALGSDQGATVRFPRERFTGQPQENQMYTVQSYQMDIPAGRQDAIVISLTRAVDEQSATRALRDSLQEAVATLKRQLVDDEEFYR